VIRSVFAEADDIVLAGGRDVIVGGDGDDLLIGGSNADAIDGGKGRDLIVGNNAELDRLATQGSFVNPRFRALAGTQIYATALNQSGDLLINRNTSYADPDWAGSPPVWGDLVLKVHDGLTLPAAGDASLTQGDNYLAGGADNDMVFGGRGDSTIQGDGSIFWDIWQGHGNRAILGGWVDLAGCDATDPNRSAFDRASFDLFGQLTEWPAAPQALPRSFEAASDGDDYIEGGSGNSVIFGNLGQNDIIGGNSNLFGLSQSSQRTDSGANIIFGGAGTRIDRNDLGYDMGPDALVSFADRHARNASVILGDNGNIFRLVGTSGANSGANLGFNYNANDPTRGDLRIKARGVDLLDYKRWELAPAAAVPTHLGFTGVIGAGDLIHGESGDDVIFGMTGDNVIFGHAGDDLIVGGFGNDWISGGTGDDGILGDDGLTFISRNGHAEPLYGIAAATQRDIATPGNQFNERIHTQGQIHHTARLFGFAYETGGNDIIYGGLGNDSIHSGAGNDGVSGAEALAGYFSGELNWLMKRTQSPTEEGLAPEAWFYAAAPYNPGNILQPAADGLWFRLYNAVDPLRMMLIDAEGERVDAASVNRVFEGGGTGIFDLDYEATTWTRAGTTEQVWDFFLNFDPTEGPRDTRFPDDTARIAAGLPSDGDDIIFGNLGNN
jgi:Ca2+-binding RTX toxin-like protein